MCGRSGSIERTGTLLNKTSRRRLLFARVTIIINKRGRGSARDAVARETEAKDFATPHRARLTLVPLSHSRAYFSPRIVISVEKRVRTRVYVRGRKYRKIDKYFFGAGANSIFTLNLNSLYLKTELTFARFE